MKKAILVCRKEFRNEADKAASVLTKFNYDSELLDLTTEEKQAYKRLAQDDFDLVITFDMAGFEKGTETGSLFYNLLSCKSIHILYGEKQAYSRYLSNKLSLAMLFFVLGKEDVSERMKEKYPQIYYIKSYPHDTTLDLIFETAFTEIQRKE